MRCRRRETESGGPRLVRVVVGVVGPVALGASAGAAGAARFALAPHAILRIEARFGGAGISGWLLLITCPVARCGLYFQLVQLVPFRIGAIALRNGEQLADAAARIKWRRNWRLRGCDGLYRSRRGKVFVLQGIPDQSSKVRNVVCGYAVHTRCHLLRWILVRIFKSPSARNQQQYYQKTAARLPKPRCCDYISRSCRQRRRRYRSRSHPS